MFKLEKDKFWDRAWSLNRLGLLLYQPKWAITVGAALLLLIGGC